VKVEAAKQKYRARKTKEKVVDMDMNEWHLKLSDAINGGK